MVFNLRISHSPCQGGYSLMAGDVVWLNRNRPGMIESY